MKRARIAAPPRQFLVEEKSLPTLKPVQEIARAVTAGITQRIL
jgi:hypothetical protein